MKKTSNIVLLLATLMVVAACGSDTEESANATLSLGFGGLEPLGSDHVYEGWIIVEGSPVSTGRFTVDMDGNPSPATFEVAAEMAESATAFVLTIEPATGDAPGPTDIHILAGDLAGGTASLSVGHAAALATDFTSAAGEFILETPSSAAPEDYAQGIWWLVPPMPFSEGLSLPALPAGWQYEGWVVGDDGPISTGRFDAPGETDSDMAGPEGGPDGDGPPFPGQDFITPATNLVGHTAVISVEPHPDNSEAPFTLKPLVKADIADVMAPTTQSMTNNATMSNPSGSATFN